jgi:hypothetical protein
MSSEVPDIEDIFLGDVSEQPRKGFKDINVKKALKKKKAEAKAKEEKEYEPSRLFKNVS